MRFLSGGEKKKLGTANTNRLITIFQNNINNFFLWSAVKVFFAFAFFFTRRRYMRTAITSPKPPLACRLHNIYLDREEAKKQKAIFILAFAVNMFMTLCEFYN